MSRDLAHIGNTLASSLAELDISLTELNALRAINEGLLQRCALRLQRKADGVQGRISDVDEPKKDDIKVLVNKTQQVFRSPFYEPRRYPFLEKLRLMETLRLENPVQSTRPSTTAMLEYHPAPPSSAPRSTYSYGNQGMAYTETFSDAPTRPLSPTKRPMQGPARLQNPVKMDVPVKSDQPSAPPTIPIEGSSKLVVWGYPINEQLTPYQETCYLFRILECGSSIPADYFNAYRGVRVVHGHPMLYIHTISESVAVLILRAFQHYKSRFPPPSKPPFWIRREMGYEERLIDKRTQAVVDIGRKMGWDYRKRDHGQIDVYAHGEKVMRLEWEEVEKLESMVSQTDEWKAENKTMEELKQMVSRSEAEFKETFKAATTVHSDSQTGSLTATPDRKTSVQQGGSTHEASPHGSLLSNHSQFSSISPTALEAMKSSPPMPRVPQSSPASSITPDTRPLNERLFPHGNADFGLAPIAEEQSSPYGNIPHLKLRGPLRLSPVRRTVGTGLPSGRDMLPENMAPLRPHRTLGGDGALKKEFLLSTGGDNVVMRDVSLAPNLPQ